MVPEKTCRVCKAAKPTSDFYRQSNNLDGLRHECKSCINAAFKIRRANNLESYRARSRRWYYANTELAKDQRRTHELAHPEQQKELVKRRVRDPEKMKVRTMVRAAIRRGELKRPSHCERCNRPAREAHHEDYSKPLDVIWLCFRCHGLVHRKGPGIVLTENGEMK